MLAIVQRAYRLAGEFRDVGNSVTVGKGTAIGFAGWVWGIALTMAVVMQRPAAAALLVPYLVWGPVGTWVTWQMRQLNR